MAFVCSPSNLGITHLTALPRPNRQRGAAKNKNYGIRCGAAPISRRELGKRILQIGLAAGMAMNIDINITTTRNAEAISGLKLFPLTDHLGNNYYLMRAGESRSDARGEAKSNPIDMMSIRERGLTKEGIDETIAAAEKLRSKGVEFDAWLWPAIATNSMETAEVLAGELNIRRERVVPEFSFLDARGLGTLDGLDQKTVNKHLRDMDTRDTSSRPEPNTDGTPNESVDQVFVKLRQLISKLETQYFGENIIIIAPDSQPLSILQATLMDYALENHHDLAFNPGELRKVEGRVVDPLDGKVTFDGQVEVLHSGKKKT